MPVRTSKQVYSAAISVEKDQASGKHCVLLTNFLLGR